jgi:large subunit ribosomal protein L33
LSKAKLLGAPQRFGNIQHQSGVSLALRDGAAYFLDFSGLPTRLPATQRNDFTIPKDAPMAKAASIKIKLLSSADTGYFYVAKKNSRTQTDKLVKKKYDPVAKKHVEFRETKIK